MSENPVERAILIYEGINRKKVFSIKPLGGGTANDVFLVNLEDVIRLNKPNKVDSSYYSAPRLRYRKRRQDRTLHPSLCL